VHLEPWTSLTITPGTYERVSVKEGAKLTLEPGVYRFSAIEALEPGSVLDAKTASGPVILYVEGSVIVRGTVMDAPGDGTDLLVVMLGAGWATLEAGFRGTLIAPYGTINLGTANGETHIGTFFGKNVEVGADATIVHALFSGFESLGACKPLTSEERDKAVSLGLDPDAVYPLGETERHVLLPVAAGERIKLGLRYEAGPAAPNTAERFRVMSMDGAKVLGGGTYVLRH
jgi:hypothetical protein